MIMATEGGQTDRQKDRPTNTVTFKNRNNSLKWLYAARPAAHCLPLVANQIEDSVTAAPEAAAGRVLALLASVLA